MEKISTAKAFKLLNNQYIAFYQPKNRKKRPRILRSIEKLTKIVTDDPKVLDVTKERVLLKLESMQRMIDIK